MQQMPQNKIYVVKNVRCCEYDLPKGHALLRKRDFLSIDDGGEYPTA